jgi:hypothetical protein
MRRWNLVDWAVAVYATYVAIIILVGHGSIPEWLPLFLLHVAFLVGLWFLPARGATWELPIPDEPQWRVATREVVRFVRYMYPLILILVFFEEGRLIVNSLFPETPYWFEPYLYAADRWLLGDLPSIRMVPWMSWPLTELMHAFYFSYFVILIGGPVFAVFTAKRRSGGKRGFRGPEFDYAIGSMTFGFLCAYVWYPWLAARGPFENAPLISSLPPFEGGPFTFLARWITDCAAVSGNCFPSAHVAGTWGLTFGVASFHRKAGWVLTLVAIGVSLSCVYTRYHHAVDVPAGILMGLTGAILFRLLSRSRGDYAKGWLDKPS